MKITSGRAWIALFTLAWMTTGCNSWQLSSDSEIHYQRSDTLRSLEVRAKGSVAFTEDEKDILGIFPHGYLLIKERRGLDVRKFQAVQEAGGTLRRSFSFQGESREVDAEARAWLARILPDVIRQTGMGAHTRVARLLKQGGSQAVLEEISRIESDGVKCLYFRELFDGGNLDSQALQRAAREISEEISSDGEKATLLSDATDPYFKDEASRPAFFKALESINSDGERAHLLSSLLNRKELNPHAFIQILKSAAGISSDGEKAGVLIETAALCPSHEAVLSEYLTTAATISSDGEKAGVLSALLKKKDLSQDMLVKLLKTAADISSDGEKAGVLERAAKVEGARSDAVRSAYIATARTISSDGERSHILNALLERGDLSKDVLKDVLQAVAEISSDGEKANVLEQAAPLCAKDEVLLSAFVAATETISSDGEYRRVMSALISQKKPVAILRDR